jgi:hypothetical protein
MNTVWSPLPADAKPALVPLPQKLGGAILLRKALVHPGGIHDGIRESQQENL